MVINEYTDFDSAINKVNTLSSGLKTIGTNFSNAMTDIESKLAGVSFAGWEDGISTKMQSALEDYKTNGINSINTDLASGGFYTLTKKVSDLYDALVGCKNISSEKKNLEYFLSSSGTEYGGRGGSTDNEDSEKELESLSIKRNNAIARCNKLIAEIGAIEYNSQYTEQETSESSAEESSGSNGPQGEYVDYNGKMVYSVDGVLYENKEVYELMIEQQNNVNILKNANDGDTVTLTINGNEYSYEVDSDTANMMGNVGLNAVYSTNADGTTGYIMGYQIPDIANQIYLSDYDSLAAILSHRYN